MAAVTVLHLSPHPDDEAIAAPATLLALREAGHSVVNVVCSLGRSGQAKRRRREAADAAARAGLALEFLDPPLRISRGDDLRAARSRLGAWVSAYVAEHEVELVVSPSPHDGHHGHELVGRAVRDGIERGERRPRWWAWGLWADLPLPTLIVEFDQQRLDAVLHVLAAHPGELERNDYAALVRCRATADRVLGAERVFGFGSPGLDGPYAELLTELGLHDGRWTAYEPRRLDAASPLLGRPGERTLTWWLDEPSFRDRLDAQLR
jgi:LmbE family N-acetylglucosaminyl deacetylase